ncbi:MAG: alpha/beta hydrolase [Comamonas sp.]|jgi:pimeloyl-ACP methyl ester carboxylesterase|nr:alpha/beta hydrolase [Comamonas sp.]HRL39910.1 alpha/beta hydrolase [Comamonas denitrificans]MBP6293738.1 alpha/beta hydrolase [Comamonas sp.]MBP7790077.1 alpha/beta hydrolase [Comamonas sp.]MBP7840858.1 alpha/beta hydrolase [Comamonas sp.]
MIESRLNYVMCPGAARAVPGGEDGVTQHRVGYWEWNQTGQVDHPHVIVCVHGLTRQGRDFDVLAQALSHHARVICPDIAGRGQSDWLADPMAYGVPQYAFDMLVLLTQVHAQYPIAQLDWVGTSMGGLIGMAVAGTPDLALPVPIRRLLLNDVGPRLEWSALQRIGTYVGQSPRFASVEEGAAWLRVQSADFGPHTDAQWLALSEPMLRPGPEGGFVLHYDPKIAVPMQGMTQEQVVQGEALLWNLYDAITAQTLVLRGAKSDLLTAQTVQEMAQRGPKAHSVTLEGVGHAPTLVQPEQVALVKEFLFR